MDYHTILQMIFMYADGEAEKHTRETGVFPKGFSGAAPSHRKSSYPLVYFLRIWSLCILPPRGVFVPSSCPFEAMRRVLSGEGLQARTKLTHFRGMLYVDE
jgi:hypothetical protein